MGAMDRGVNVIAVLLNPRVEDRTTGEGGCFRDRGARVFLQSGII